MFESFKKRWSDKNQVYCDFKKTLDVAISCRTADQCDTAENFVKAYIRRHDIEIKSPLLTQLCPRIIHYLSGEEYAVALILESVGYCDHREGSQRLPPLVRVSGISRGDFLAVVGNHQSHDFAEGFARIAA